MTAVTLLNDPGLLTVEMKARCLDNNGGRCVWLPSRAGP